MYQTIYSFNNLFLLTYRPSFCLCLVRHRLYPVTITQTSHSPSSKKCQDRPSQKQGFLTKYIQLTGRRQKNRTKMTWKHLHWIRLLVGLKLPNQWLMSPAQTFWGKRRRNSRQSEVRNVCQPLEYLYIETSIPYLFRCIYITLFS